MGLIYPGKQPSRAMLFQLIAFFVPLAAISQTYSPPIEFLHSAYGAGYGSKIYPVDQGNGATSLRIATRGGSTVWTDALWIRAADNNGGGNGNIGVGADPGPSYKFAVNGPAIFNKVTVKQYPWPDYVFDSSYHLPSLDSIASFINLHHHLSNMPTADSVAANGIDLGYNQAALLKKIEELTLYIIAQGKDLREARARLAEEHELVIKTQQELQERITRLERMVVPGK